jgi:uncharacterized RDD family membrane protein YckC
VSAHNPYAPPRGAVHDVAGEGLALLVARYGQTMGKRLLEMRVVRSDGSQAPLRRIFWLRNVVNALLGIIPLYSIIDVLLIFGVRRQCIHDSIADTIVVRA